MGDMGIWGTQSHVGDTKTVDRNTFGMWKVNEDMENVFISDMGTWRHAGTNRDKGEHWGQ